MSLMTETERRVKQEQIATKISEVRDRRDELVQSYTAKMQAATLPKTVLKLSLKLSELVFELDREVYRLEYEMPVTLAVTPDRP